MDEMAQLNLMGSDIPTPTPAELRGEERRLLAEIATPGSERLPGSGVLERLMRPVGGGRPRPVLVAGVATGLAAASVAGVALTGVHSRGPGSSYLPQAVPVAVVQTLGHAADAASRQRELHPKPGQFLVFESQTMEPTDSNSKEHGHSRYLSRARRTIWLPVSGRATGGVLLERGLPAKQYGNWPLPPEARQEVGTTGPTRAADVDNRAEYLRTDYAYLSRLPADPKGMRAHLYTGLKAGTAQGDLEAWSRVGGMLTEAYMPAAQRAALFRAAATIPGAEAVGSAEDAAGRTGVAVARVEPAAGERTEYIFDRRTYTFLGQRTVVVDAEKAQAPVGTVTESTAQLSVRVADSAPKVSGG
ncbi:CU044_5270 family protein [Actinoallomurus sp. NPDC050550]|uniref:CU044_5270 family protein n=1 Tax=Actinoallomurus sp. NPDC050550 TaxID=3154937 RepID=UPI0033D5A452